MVTGLSEYCMCDLWGVHVCVCVCVCVCVRACVCVILKLWKVCVQLLMPRVISSVLSPTRSPERRLPGLCTHSCLFRNVWKLCCNWCCGLGNVKDVGGCQGPVGSARKIVARTM